MTISTRSNSTTTGTSTMAPSPSSSDSSTVPVALFMPLAAPQLKSTSHAALVQWRKLRREYEDEVAMRCKNDADKMAEVLVSVKKSFNKRLLEVWCEFDWEVDIDTVTDEFIIIKVDEIIASVKNNAVPDVAALFKENVKMDLSESDVRERVMQFFAKSREFVEEQGWQEFFTGNEGRRLKCKLLVESLEPRSLREEIVTTVKYLARAAKESEKELFKLILDKALEQDRDFQRRKRSRSSSQAERNRKTNGEKESSEPRTKYRKIERSGANVPKASSGNLKQGQQKSGKGPTGGCLHCKGDHWLVHCPTASHDLKKELLKKMHDRRDRNKTPKRTDREA